MVFANRQEAGELLAKKLGILKINPKKAVVAGIARGGVAVAGVIARKLGIPLTAVVIKKLGAPYNPELAIGATASFGKPVLDRWLIADSLVSKEYLKGEVLKKRREAARREKFLGISSFDYSEKDVIVVDDGLATGQTARAAAKVLKNLGANRLILAVPCASPSTLDLVGGDYDEVVCPVVDPELVAVGQFYSDFSEVSDSEVKRILQDI